MKVPRPMTWWGRWWFRCRSLEEFLTMNMFGHPNKNGGFHQKMLIPTGEFLGLLGLCFFSARLKLWFCECVSICFYITRIHYIIATPYQSTIIMGDQAILVLPTHFSWAGGWLIPLDPDATKEGWAAWSLLRLCDDAGRRKLSTTRYLAPKGGKTIGMVYGAY